MNHFLRELYIYPGRVSNHDYKAWRLQNVAVYGDMWVSVVNNLLLRLLMESNPNELEMISYLGEKSVWNNVNSLEERYHKIIPQIKKNYSINSGDEFVSIIKKIYTKIQLDISKHVLADRSTVYIMTFDEQLTDVQFEEVNHMLDYIQSYGAANGVYLMFVGRDVPEYQKQATTLQIDTLQEDDENFKRGTAYVLPDNVSVYIPFFPDTFLTKHMRSYSVNIRE